MIPFLILLFRSHRPLVNSTLIAISLMVFLYELFLGGNEQAIFFYKYGLIPAELSKGVEFVTVVFTRGCPISAGFITSHCIEREWGAPWARYHLSHSHVGNGVHLHVFA